MNLELLDPFRRQIPDRVDATLSMPDYMHLLSTHHTNNSLDSSSNHATDKNNTKSSHQQQTDDEDWKAAFHVAYNRRGTYLAVGYGSGTVGVHDVLSRTLAALYRGSEEAAAGADRAAMAKKEQHGVTSVSWSRRSRTLLAGAAGDSLARLYDTTHPYGPGECTLSLATADAKENADNQNQNLDDDLPSNSRHNKEPRSSQTGTSASQIHHGNFSTTLREPSFISSTTTKSISGKQGQVHEKSKDCVFSKEPRQLSIQEYDVPQEQPQQELDEPSAAEETTKFPALHFHFPQPVNGSLQVHPHHASAGLAVLTDGSLVIFWIPPNAWETSSSDSHTSPTVKLWYPWGKSTITPQSQPSQQDKEREITCACFDPHGENLYAVTKSGMLLGLQVGSVFSTLQHYSSDHDTIDKLLSSKQKSFQFQIPGGPTTWHILVTRNCKDIVINCADGTLRLYHTKECWNLSEEDPKSTSSMIYKPHQVFQDVVSKVKFASCDVSGDGEYIVGGANGNDDKYVLYIWNTNTGALMDKLTGAPVTLYSVAWHPTRSFLAVATSDGLTDIWGPRINWTAFAPDFQALPMNVEYIEQEDEFDEVDAQHPKKDGIIANRTTENDDDDMMIEDEGAQNDTRKSEKYSLNVVAEDDEDEDGGSTSKIDVVGIEPVPVFASDSEDENDVFYFETKITNVMGGRGRQRLSYDES